VLEGSRVLDWRSRAKRGDPAEVSEASLYLSGQGGALALPQSTVAMAESWYADLVSVVVMDLVSPVRGEIGHVSVPVW